jgi:hypothetical protein
VLHCVAHLFYDGEIRGALRELLDIKQMLAHFGRDETFWHRLPERAEQLELARPLYYALHFCGRLLGAPIPRQTLDAVVRLGAPPAAASALMELLVTRTLSPGVPGESEATISGILLYIRSHWLRMPPWLLARHLSRKAWRRIQTRHGAPT